MHFKLSRYSLWPSVTSVVTNLKNTEDTEFTEKFTEVHLDNLNCTRIRHILKIPLMPKAQQIHANSHTHMQKRPEPNGIGLVTHHPQKNSCED